MKADITCAEVPLIWPEIQREGEMINVTDLASYRATKRRDDRAYHLQLWRAYEGTYRDLCQHDDQCAYDRKILRELWEDYARDMPKELRAWAMLGSLG